MHHLTELDSAEQFAVLEADSSRKWCEGESYRNLAYSAAQAIEYSYQQIEVRVFRVLMAQNYLQDLFVAVIPVIENDQITGLDYSAVSVMLMAKNNVRTAEFICTFW